MSSKRFGKKVKTGKSKADKAKPPLPKGELRPQIAHRGAAAPHTHFQRRTSG